MKIKDFFENVWYYIYHKGICRIIPSYNGRTIFTRFYWRTLHDRMKLGFDETETWSMDYSLAKLIAPRLKMFIKEFECHRICANYCHDIAKNQLLAKGYKYDAYHYRFENKKIRDRAYKIAEELWHRDLTIMYDAFQDIVDENNDWNNWVKKFDEEAKSLNKKLSKLKTIKEKKALWKSIVDYREYDATCKFSSDDISYKLRKEGLKLFGEHFQELWW